ncbi:YaeQ family protein [uncultured Desulfobacter sp.]|nr:YaeQ family protein [uncultured Desulfobacter sp.]
MSTDKTDDNSCSKSLFKANITLADVDRNVYDTLNLTLSQHPSESVER